MHERIEEFLDRATEGLRDDDELRRETRAELATHVEEKLRELTEAGAPDGEAIEETLKAMGESLEVAGELNDANRGRMNLRARIRMFLRFAIVPAAILAAAWAADWPGPLHSIRAFDAVATDSWHPVDTVPGRNLTDRERLILYGDTSRTDEVDQQKAIWEADPTNRVYFGHYFIHALSHAGDITNLNSELIDTAITFDPENALYHDLKALHVLGAMRPPASMGEYDNMFGEEFSGPAEAQEVNGAILLYPAEDADADAPPRYEVLDRERLDRGMAFFEEALRMPRLRRYQMDMLEERLQIMGPPERMLDVLRRVSTSASVLLPSLAHQRELVRAATAYGDLLLREGEAARAAVFLNGWETKAHQLLGRADTLIELLFAGAIIDQGKTAAAAYREAGMEREAERMAARVEAAAAPLARWKAAREDMNGRDLDEVVMRHGSVLASLLIPAVGESLPVGALEPSRRLEYTVVTEGLVGGVLVALFVAMAGCLLVALKWRFARNGRVIPILLVPRLKGLAWILGLGVVLPGAVFLVVTRSLPISGHAYSIHAGAHKLIAEFGLLILALTSLPAWLSARMVRKRCADLRVPTTRLAARYGLWLVAVGATALAILWCLPAAQVEFVTLCAWIAAGIGGLGLVAAALASLGQGLAGRPGHGLFLGTLHRSLIPVLAATAIALSLLARPVLYTSEAAYIRQDTMFITSEVGFTSLENQVTNRLRGEMLAALDALKASR